MESEMKRAGIRGLSVADRTPWMPAFWLFVNSWRRAGRGVNFHLKK